MAMILRRCISNTQYRVCKVTLGNNRQFASVASIFYKNDAIKPSYVHNVGPTLTPSTMGKAIDVATDIYGDLVAFKDYPQGITKTFVDLKKDVDRLATGLLALKLQRGDRIAILSPNRYEWSVTQMAVMKAGLILVPLNARFQPKELEYILRKLTIRAIVAPNDFKLLNFYKILTMAIPEIADSKPGQVQSKTHPYFDTLILFSEEEVPGALKFKDVMNAGGSNEMKQLEDLQKKIQFEDIAMIHMTSGTTGFPKGACLSHDNIFGNYTPINEYVGQIHKRQTLCCVLPFFHIFGSIGVNLGGLMCGSTIVIPSPIFQPDIILKTIEREKCTSIFGTPTMFFDLLRHPNFPKTDVSTLEYGNSYHNILNLIPSFH